MGGFVERPSLHSIDIAVIVAYLAAMLGMGLYFMRRQTSASEYLLASRSIGWFAIGLSLLSSLNSALDYIVGPAAYIEWGLVLGMGILAVILAFPFVFYLFIPFYQRLKILNCYEYLEYRFDVRVRTTASAIFILWRICWMAFTIYLPAYALNVVMGLPLIPTIVVLGVITTSYTTMGGARAVVWTDVVQAIIMFTGLLLATIIAVRQVPGGLVGVWNAAEEQGLLQVTARIPEWDGAGVGGRVVLYFTYPITILSVVLANFLSQLNNYGADQVMIQRYLSSRSLRDCQKGFIVNAVAYIVYVCIFFVLSMALMAFFRHHPVPMELLPAGSKFEFYFPYFIGTGLPVVVKGMVLVAIYSAAQSSVSAGISASTSVIFGNFYRRLIHGEVKTAEHVGERIEGQYMFFNRCCALGLGLTVTTVACLIQGIGEGLFEIANKIVFNFAGVMIPVFLLGMFSRRARSLGVALGAVSGVIAMFVWGFGYRFGLFERELGYGWTSSVGFVTTVVVAYLISYFEKDPPPEKMRFLWKNVMADSDLGIQEDAASSFPIVH
jgi:SSS family transporter